MESPFHIPSLSLDKTHAYFQGRVLSVSILGVIALHLAQKIPEDSVWAFIICQTLPTYFKPIKFGILNMFCVNKIRYRITCVDAELFLPCHIELLDAIWVGFRRWGSRDVPWPESLTVEM